MKLATENWETIPPLVEAIIKARTVTSKKTLKAKGATHVIESTRPLRFREFSAEVRIDNSLAYRFIRGGIIPPQARQAAIAAWCKKHAKHLKP